MIDSRRSIHWLTRPIVRHPGVRWVVFLLVAVIAAHRLYGQPTELNGFQLTDLRVSLGEIQHGGPPRDGIPALTDPATVAADQIRGLGDDDRVIGVVFDGIARAYPLRILNYHEIVNDILGQQKLLVTYCPLCGTGIVFDADLAGERLVFGVSGLLYRSDVLMYDRSTDSLWSQLAFSAISGPHSGRALKLLPATHTEWGDWREQHPDTSVLSFDTGHVRDYARDPYRGYAESPGLYFPVGQVDQRYPAKSWVAGLVIDGQARAYPFAELQRVDSQWFTDRLGDRTIRVRFDARNQRVEARGEHGESLPVIPAFWFAWMAFYPESSVFRSPR